MNKTFYLLNCYICSNKHCLNIRSVKTKDRYYPFAYSIPYKHPISRLFVENLLSAEGIRYEFGEKKDIKFMKMIRESDGQVVKSSIGRPVMIDKKFSVSFNLGDLGGGVRRDKIIEYDWIQMALPERDLTTKSEQSTIVKKPEYIQDMDDNVKKIMGAPFAKSSQTLFTGAPIKMDDMRVVVSASSCSVLRITTRENRWLNNWAIGYYIYDLINRYDTIDKLDLILSEEIKGKFGYTSIKLLAERGTKVRLLTTSSIKEKYFHEHTDNLTLKDTKQYQRQSPVPKLDCAILVNGREVHMEKFGENTYSDNPIFISDVQSDFDRLWDIDENTRESSTSMKIREKKPLRRHRRLRIP